jgi:hypothetical protein
LTKANSRVSVELIICCLSLADRYAIKPQLDEIGVKLVDLLHENIPEQVGKLPRLLSCSETATKLVPVLVAEVGGSPLRSSVPKAAPSAQVEGYTPEYWPGEIYLDENKDFFKALHGGEVSPAEAESTRT